MSSRGTSDDDVLYANFLRGNTAIIVLSILRNEPAHGYAIASTISELTSGELEFKQGTLYPLLHELERDGFITSEWQIQEGERPRRVYTITPGGRQELTRRMEAWQRFSSAMSRVTGVALDEQNA
jgi:transcriptional regulator